MLIEKSKSGIFWVILYNGIEIDRFDKKWQAIAACRSLIKLV